MSTEAKIPSPIEVIETMDMAANHGDMVNILNLFTDDATITFQQPFPPFQPSYQGKDQIRSFLQSLITKEYHVTSSNIRVAGNEVTWDSKIKSQALQQLGIDEAQVTSHAVLWGSLIQSWAITPSQEMVQKAQASMAAQGQR